LPQSRHNEIVNWEVFFGVISVAAGLASLVWSAWTAHLAVMSRRWPQVEGTIVVSDLQRSKDSEDGYSYRPEVSYRYTVDGNEIVGSRIRFGLRLETSWSAPAVRVIQHYKVGARVPVRYDPNDPEECVLESGINGTVFAGAALAVALLMFGVFWLRSSW
jgi:hypothetical protein